MALIGKIPPFTSPNYVSPTPNPSFLAQPSCCCHGPPFRNVFVGRASHASADVGGTNQKMSRYINPFVQFSGTTTDNCDTVFATISTFPDEALLEIFDFYVCEADEKSDWETQSHVCRRWRHLVFSAPHRLKLRIFCTVGTPATTMVDVWPALPIDMGG